jgi:hypothetical protein
LSIAEADEEYVDVSSDGSDGEVVAIERLRSKSEKRGSALTDSPFFRVSFGSLAVVAALLIPVAFIAKRARSSWRTCDPVQMTPTAASGFGVYPRGIV